MKEGISIDALEIGEGLHVVETDVDASWETWEKTNDDEGKLEFCDVYTGVTLDPIAVGAARQEELRFAESLGAWAIKPGSGAMRHMGRARYVTRWLDHNKGNTPNLNTAADLLFKRHAEPQ